MKCRFIIIFSLLTCLLNAQITEKKVSWDYPVKPGSIEWVNFTTGRQMVEACQIPQEVLDTINTRNLAEICINYPLFLDYSALNDERKGISNMIERFNGLKELNKRKNGVEELINIYKNFPILTEVPQKSSKDYYAPLKLPFIELLLSDDSFIKQLNNQMSVELEKIILDKYIGKLENPHIYSVYNIKKTFLLGAVVMMHNKKFENALEQHDIVKRYIENYFHSDSALLTEISKIITAR